MDKGDFIGKQALLARRDAGLRKQLVTLQIDTTSGPAHGGASLMDQDRVVGTITSGDWGYRTGLNLGYAFVEPEYAQEGQNMARDHCGAMVPAKVIAASPYDPTHGRMRG